MVRKDLLDFAASEEFLRKHGADTGAWGRLALIDLGRLEAADDGNEPRTIELVMPAEAGY